MPRIAHTADIHIRSLSRHDEYRQVLKAFTDDCREQNVEHIFVGGDIFHTKTTGISGEYIDLLTWWLNDMSSVADVHLVLGNHDGNLVNLTRQDAVSPIVDAMNNSKIHLYKKSGIYPFAKGFNWCVFSCFDEEGWKDVKPVAGDVNIATFHGAVAGSVVESQWEVEDGIKVSMFENFDFCLLGDIHAPQTLGYRSGKPWIAYPGSPIQQNYSEKIEHGYLIWDIQDSSSWSVETRRLPNPNPYVTIDWAGSSKDTLDIASTFPKGSRFRVRTTSQLTQDEIHALSDELKSRLSAAEITIKSDFEIDKKTVIAGTTSLDKSDLRSPETVMRLLKDYHKDVYLSDDDLLKITEIVKRHLKTVESVDDVSRGSSWNLRSLKWDNLFSYGEDNSINFDKLNGIVGIFGPNRTGKSSIIGSLMYALFNTTDRGSLKNINVCNVRKNYCSANVVIEHNGTPYVVERQTTKVLNRRGGLTAPTSLNLFRMRDDGEMDDLCGEQRADTEKTLKTLFGQHEDFLMTSVSAQGETNQFISLGSTKRRSILTRFLDLDIFDRLYDLSSKEVNSIKSQIKNFPERDWSNLISTTSEDMTACKNEISEISKSIADLQANLAIYRQELARHNADPVTQNDVDNQKNKILELQKNSKECSENIETLSKEMLDMSMKANTLKEFIDRTNIIDLKTKLESQTRLEKIIINLSHSYEKEDTLLAQQKKSLKILDEVPCGDQFLNCKFIKDAHSIKKVLPSQIQKAKNAQDALRSAKDDLEKIKDDTLQDRINKTEKAKDLLSKLDLEIAKKDADIEKQKTSCELIQKNLLDSKKKLKSLETALIDHKNDEVVNIREKMNELIEFIKKLDDKKIEIATKHGKLISNLEKIQQEKQIRDSLLVDMRLHELVSNAFSKKGIPLIVTKSQLPVINAEVTKILQGIVDFTINLESDEDTDSLEIYIDYGDSKRMIELCSGMEKTMASIALRVAMTNITSLPKPNFFIVDEGFGTLDSSAVEACNRLLGSLKKYFKVVLVITHVDGIKDSADHILEITKCENDSKMEYV